MKNKLIIFLSSICLISCVYFLTRCYFYYQTIEKQQFPKNTTIYINELDINASKLSPKEIYNIFLKEQNKDFIVTINDKDYTLDLNGSYINSINENDFKQLIDNISLKDYLFKYKYIYNITFDIKYDKAILADKLSEIITYSNYEPIKSQDAYLDKNTYEIIYEVQGTEFDIDLIIDSIVKNIKDKNLFVNLNQDKFYINPNKTSIDIQRQYQDLLNIVNWSASYCVTDYVISMKDYMNYVTESNGIYIIDPSFLKNAVLELSKTVDKNGITRRFNSTLDGEIFVSGGTYGQIMDNDKEIKYLTEKLNAGEIVKNREPIWKKAPKDDDYENTYIEVDLSEQYVWYYKDNELIMESECVTGTKDTSRQTPTGFYYVSEKINGKYLTGPGYKTWVDKWMRITNRGHGLHDANWRRNSEFGGNTYTYDGSHGCINLPVKFAYELYDQIDVGILVVIHD